MRPPLALDQLTDSDLPDICLRMFLVLDSFEFARCEGRLLPTTLFDSIDTLESNLRHKPLNRLAEWRDTIIHFGEYYGLDGREPIEVTDQSIENHRYISAKHSLDLGFSSPENTVSSKKWWQR